MINKTDFVFRRKLRTSLMDEESAVLRPRPGTMEPFTSPRQWWRKMELWPEKSDSEVHHPREATMTTLLARHLVFVENKLNHPWRSRLWNHLQQPEIQELQVRILLLNQKSGNLRSFPWKQISQTFTRIKKTSPSQISSVRSLRMVQAGQLRESWGPVQDIFSPQSQASESPPWLILMKQRTWFKMNSRSRKSRDLSCVTCVTGTLEGEISQFSYKLFNKF